MLFLPLSEGTFAWRTGGATTTGPDASPPSYLSKFGGGGEGWGGQFGGGRLEGVGEEVWPRVSQGGGAGTEVCMR